MHSKILELQPTETEVLLPVKFLYHKVILVIKLYLLDTVLDAFSPRIHKSSKIFLHLKPSVIRSRPCLYPDIQIMGTKSKGLEKSNIFLRRIKV